MLVLTIVSERRLILAVGRITLIFEQMQVCKVLQIVFESGLFLCHFGKLFAMRVDCIKTPVKHIDFTSNKCGAIVAMNVILIWQVVMLNRRDHI